MIHTAALLEDIIDWVFLRIQIQCIEEHFLTYPSCMPVYKSTTTAQEFEGQRSGNSGKRPTEDYFSTALQPLGIFNAQCFVF